MKTLTAGMLLTLLVLMAVPAGAAFVSVEIDDVVVLSPPPESPEAPRLLVSFDLPPALSGVTIDHASLAASASITSPEVAAQAPLVVEACAVTTAWQAGSVGWSTGWDEPGGDFDLQSRATFVGDAAGSVSLGLDLTHIVQVWADGMAENHGVIIMLPAACGHAVTGLDMQTSPPVLEVYYSGRE